MRSFVRFVVVVAGLLLPAACVEPTPDFGLTESSGAAEESGEPTSSTGDTTGGAVGCAGEPAACDGDVRARR